MVLDGFIIELAWPGSDLRGAGGPGPMTPTKPFIFYFYLIRMRLGFSCYALLITILVISLFSYALWFNRQQVVRVVLVWLAERVSRHPRHARLVATSGASATMSRGCYDETAVVEFGLYSPWARADLLCRRPVFVFPSPWRRRRSPQPSWCSPGPVTPSKYSLKTFTRGRTNH